jgi:mitofusin
LDGWIDQQCLDADVFVLVVNAESTLTKTEKEFFHKVSERLSKPNVFILNNRWDATAYEPETAEIVKVQHLQRNTEFLCNELKVCDLSEVNKRIYFVSAREALFTRTQTNPQLPPGYQGRLLQFEWFEAEFEKCISMSAVKTKFDQPSQRGKIMASSLRKILEDSYQRGNDLKAANEKSLKDVIDKIEEIERKLQDFTKNMKDKIRDVIEDVEKNVSFTLNDEIKKIYNLIDQYERPFHPEEHQINWYKKELHKFVEQKLGSNLASRLNMPLIQNLDLTQKDIRNSVLELVESEDNKNKVNSTLPRADFMITYRLDCSNLCSDFREDISFHFSLGFTALMRRFSGNKAFNSNSIFATNLFNLNKSSQSSSGSGSNDQKEYQAASYQSSSSNLNAFALQNEQTNNLLFILQGFQMVASKSNVMLFAVGGIVWRGLGWKILAITGSLYGLCYLYERLMWTRKTQEKLFKKQYADYASSKLKLIVDLTSQNAAGQVQQFVLLLLNFILSFFFSFFVHLKGVVYVFCANVPLY